MRVAVIGGHGKVASELCRLLTAQGHEVAALFRNPAHREDVAATGATPVVADLESLDTTELAEHLRDHDAVVWSAGAGGGDPARTRAVDRDAAIRCMDAAATAGVRRFVMVSYFGAGHDHGLPEDHGFAAYAQAKADADAHLRRGPLDWTILGPSRLTDDPPTGKISTGAGVTGGEVPRGDVAAMAATVLDRPDTFHRTIDFNAGDERIDQALGLPT